MPDARLTRTQLGLVYLSGTFGFGFQQMAAFLVPLRAYELDAPLDQIGIIVGAGAVVPALLSVWSGELSDRFGARRAYIVSTLVAALCGFLLFPVTNYLYLLPIQLVMGFARSTAWVASQTYIANIGEPHERATHMGRLSFATNGGTFVAPLVIGQVANAVGYQASFLFMGGVTLLYTLIGVIIPDIRARRTTRQRGGAGGFEAALRLVRQRGVQVVLLLTFVRLWNSSGWRPFIPIYLREAGFDNTLISSVLAANSVVSTFTALWASWLARRSSNEVAADQRGVALGMRMSMNQAASAVAPVSVGAIAEPFGIPVALLASGVFSMGVLGISMVLYGSRATRRAPLDTAEAERW